MSLLFKIRERKKHNHGPTYMYVFYVKANSTKVKYTRRISLHEKDTKAQKSDETSGMREK